MEPRLIGGEHRPLPARRRRADQAAMEPRLIGGEHDEVLACGVDEALAAMEPRLIGGEHTGAAWLPACEVAAAMEPRLIGGEHLISSPPPHSVCLRRNGAPPDRRGAPPRAARTRRGRRRRNGAPPDRRGAPRRCGSTPGAETHRRNGAPPDRRGAPADREERATWHVVAAMEPRLIGGEHGLKEKLKGPVRFVVPQWSPA